MTVINIDFHCRKVDAEDGVGFMSLSYMMERWSGEPRGWCVEGNDGPGEE